MSVAVCQGVYHMVEPVLNPSNRIDPQPHPRKLYHECHMWHVLSSISSVQTPLQSESIRCVLRVFMSYRWIMPTMAFVLSTMPNFLWMYPYEGPHLLTDRQTFGFLRLRYSPYLYALIRMESFNGNTIRHREKVVRGIKKEDSTILTGLQLYHNYVRPHLGLNGNTSWSCRYQSWR